MKKISFSKFKYISNIPLNQPIIIENEHGIQGYLILFSKKNNSKQNSDLSKIEWIFQDKIKKTKNYDRNEILAKYFVEIYERNNTL